MIEGAIVGVNQTWHRLKATIKVLSLTQGEATNMWLTCLGAKLVRDWCVVENMETGHLQDVLLYLLFQLLLPLQQPLLLAQIYQHFHQVHQLFQPHHKVHQLYPQEILQLKTESLS